jgi:hypothetical protein
MMIAGALSNKKGRATKKMGTNDSVSGRAAKAADESTSVRIIVNTHFAIQRCGFAARFARL